MRKVLCKKLKYIRKTFCKSPIAAQAIDEEISKSDLPKIHLSPEEAKILQFLIISQKVSKIVEIGTHVGYSAIWMAEALKQNGTIYTIEKDMHRAQMAQNNFSKYRYDNIKLYQGDAMEVLSSLEESGPFDMVFIDANKTRYPDYLEWSEKNIKSGGLIVADNVLLFGTLFQDPSEWPATVSKKMVDNMRIFNERINNEEKFFSIILPTDEGLSISIKK